MNRSICPGCGQATVPHDGPTHRYLGASPACWDRYTRLLAGEPEMGSSLQAEMLVDAYAAQHPGVDSPQARQSVAVHLVALHARHGAGDMGVDLNRLRVAAVEAGRAGAPYPWLQPAPEVWSSTIFDVAGAADPVARARAVGPYTRGVWEAWTGRYRRVVEEWYDRARALV